MNQKLRIEELKNIYRGEYVSQYLQKSDTRLSRLLPYFDLQTNDVVADFGCGSGMLAELIADRVTSYIGVDFSEEFIAAANNRITQKGISNAYFECADIIQFCTLHKQRFDKVFTLDFSEHLYDEGFIAIYQGIFESLRPGGKLYLHTPNGDYFLEILKKVGVLRQLPGHVAVRNGSEYMQVLQRIGFQPPIHVWYLAHYLAPLSYFHFLSYLPGLGKFFRARILLECVKEPSP